MMKKMKSFSCFKPRDPFRNWSKELDKRVAIWAKNFNSSFKLLLLGPAGAGKTTILKQMKIIHFEGFTLEERQQKAKEIRTNLLESVRELTACITSSGRQINWCDKENQNRLDFINGLNLDDQTYDLYAAKIYDYSKRILTDKGVEELFAQLNQLSLTHRSQYLLNRVDEIRSVNYIPNNDDILQSRRKTSDIQKIEFQVKLPIKTSSSLGSATSGNKNNNNNNNEDNNIHQTFCMFDVGGQRGERRKWIQVFDGVSAVMFLIDSSSFDTVDEENGRNKLKETINLFYEVWTTRFLLNSNFVLLFNKQDILKEKIERGHKIEDYFPEYKQYKLNQHQTDRALLSKAGEKLNLFRSSNSNSSSRNNSRNSSSRLSMGNVITTSWASSSSTAAAAAAAAASNQSISGSTTGTIKSTIGFGSLREKRKSSLYKSINISGHNLNPLAKNNSVSPNMSPSTLSYSSSNTPISSGGKSSTTTTTTHNDQMSQQNSSTSTTPTSPQNTATTNINLNINTTDCKQSPEMAYIKARSFIRDKFLQITRQVDHDQQRKFSAQNLMYNSKGCVDQPKRNVCYHYTTATDTENIRDLFDNLQKMVIKSTLKDLG